jgi:hypothetical protein
VLTVATVQRALHDLETRARLVRIPAAKAASSAVVDMQLDLAERAFSLDHKGYRALGLTT